MKKTILYSVCLILCIFSYIKCVIKETNIETFLKKSLVHKKSVLISNQGNAGDALIWYGTVCLFNKIGLNYVISNNPKLFLAPKTDVVIYSGGGNLVPYYDHLATFIKNYMHKIKQLIILPHTIQGHTNLLKSLRSNVIIFCREHMSYKYCKKVVPFPQNVFFSRDMAFYSNLSAYGNTNYPSRTNDLFAFRTDVEINSARQGYVLPSTNKDVSTIGYISGDTSFESNKKLVNHFLSIIAQYSTIWTDRLHVGIAAFLLGKKVHFFDNSYGKNHALYKASIAPTDLEKKVVFHGVNFSLLPFS